MRELSDNMPPNELRTILTKELGIGSLPEDMQGDILAKVGEFVLQSLTMVIFDKLSTPAREEFEKLSAKGDDTLIAEFLGEQIPEFHTLLTDEVKKAIELYKETDGKVAVKKE